MPTPAAPEPIILDRRVRGSSGAWLHLSWTPPQDKSPGFLTLSASDSDARLVLPADQILEARQIFAAVTESLRDALKAAIAMDPDAERQPVELAQGGGIALSLMPIADRWRIRILNEREDGVGILLSSHEFSRFVKQLSYFKTEDPYQSIRFADMVEGGIDLPDPDATGKSLGGRAVLLAPVAALLGMYCKGAFLLPALLATITGAVLRRWGPERSRPMYDASALQVGYGAWLLIALLANRKFDLDLLDPIILLVGAAWLLWRPGWAPVLILTAYHVFGLILNIPWLTEIPFASPEHRVLVMQVVLRASSIVTMAYGMYVLRKNTSAKPENVEPPYGEKGRI